MVASEEIPLFPLGTVLFPLLSRHAERQRMDALREDLSLGLRLIIYTGVPASVASNDRGVQARSGKRRRPTAARGLHRQARRYRGTRAVGR